jgi:hypothetical protein
MSTVPVPGGLVAVISVLETTDMLALTPPNSTAVAPVKPLPLMVTVSPPTAAPLAGETEVTCGDATGAAGLVGA